MVDSPPRHGSIYTPAYQHLIKQLRAARLLSGLTQVQAARALGRPISFISKCELGERKVDPVDLMEFGILYGQPVEYFLPPVEMVQAGMDAARTSRRRRKGKAGLDEGAE